jgi:hypothetical protein
MLKFESFRVAAVMAVFMVLVMAGGATSLRTEATEGRQPISITTSADSLTGQLIPAVQPAYDQESIEAVPGRLSPTATFYTVRADLRRCMSPMCGGYFVKRVNEPLTRCANGRYQAECYVAEIDWNGQPEVDSGLAILRGELSSRRYSRVGAFGVLRVDESWQAVNNNRPTGAFYLVRDSGVRCIAYPCPTYHETELNSSLSRNIAGVNLDRSSSGRVTQAMTGTGVIVAGDHISVKGPGGRSLELKATQVYLRAGKGAAGLKPCIKSGCSSQVCSDHNVISTCEWRAEYACYQKATCERQADGNCGFTRTTQLTACLTATK